MSFYDVHARRKERDRQRRLRARRRRLLAIGALLAVVAIIVAVAASSSGSSNHATASSAAAARRARHHQGSRHSSAGAPTLTGTGAKATGIPGSASVPILMYHVINPPPAGAPFPGLYVPLDEFAAQMQALKAAGWHAVTMDQLYAYWKRGVPLGPGRPIVLTFDNGYESQYTNAMPVLKRLGWPGVENIQLTGLPPSQGGLTDAQVRGLLAAGWELDTQGMSHADLIAQDPAGLRYQIDTARSLLRSRFHVAVNWFCYPSGHYNATVVAAVRAAGFIGSTTVIPGWASPKGDPFSLPRLRVLGGTSPSALLSQIASVQGDPPPPGSYG